jgi:predicted acylesterase/phospholipase RssA
MNSPKNRPTIGLALSGSGNRTSFYIGFLEVLQEQKIPIDCISTCSGGCLVAAAYACGTLEELKSLAFSLNKKVMRSYLERSKNGGLYSMEFLEKVFRREITKGLNFEEVRPHMSFAAVDVESAEKVYLCMGDIAKAARISCTIPGIFEPAMWGDKILVDGGLLTTMPTESLKEAGADIIIGIDMRGVRHIFTKSQITIKKVFNNIKKLFFIDELENWIDILLQEEGKNWTEKKPKLFSVLGKSLDVIIQAEKNNYNEPQCDLLITPVFEKCSNIDLTQKNIRNFYNLGRQTAREHLCKIRTLISEKSQC